MPSASTPGYLTVDRPTLERLAALLLERAGLKINSEGYHSLRLALTARLPAVGTDDAKEYVQWLHEPSGEHELRSLIPLVTVGYTEFFRDVRQFRALEMRLLPDMLTNARNERRVAQIWSAGCATGEEAYSLAIAVHELGAKPAEVEVFATDLNLAAVEHAKTGIYPARRLSGVGPTRLTHYFQAGPTSGFEVQSFVRPYIRFEGHNLASPLLGRVMPESMDLILCRNVIIYFDLPTIRSVMERFLQCLRPGGYLLLGYSESLFKVYDRFEMVEVEGAFVYRRPLPNAPPKTRPAPITDGRRFTPTQIPAALPAKPGPITTPLSTARRTSQTDVPIAPPARSISQTDVPLVATGPLEARRPSQTDVPAAAAVQTPFNTARSLPTVAYGRSPQERLDAAVFRMEHGEFELARTDLETLTREEPNDLDALLTLGNLHSLFGEHVEAIKKFELALQREPLCVDARVFLGVAALQANDLTRARSELSRALFLEPTLALGHYLLAQAHERAQQHDDARRAYRNAIAQLRYPQRSLAGHYPDTPDSTEAISRAARYALAALEEA